LGIKNYNRYIAPEYRRQLNEFIYPELYNFHTENITGLNEPNITNPEQFIDDLIEAFESCYYSKEYIAENIYDQYKLDDTPDYFIWIRNKFIKKLYTDTTTFKDLSDILYHLIEIIRKKE